MSPESLHDRVTSVIDQDQQDLVDLCLKLGNLPDYPGHERPVGEAVVEWFQAADIPSFLQFITEESVNAIGVLRGTGDRASGGRSLILNAHMDTQGAVPAGGPEVEKRIRGAWVEGELVYGRGLANDKAQLCAAMIAARAIKKAGVQLKGDLMVTGVAQETSAPLVNGEQATTDLAGTGPHVSQMREGHGSRWLVERGLVADYALVGEVSDFMVTVAQSGYLRLRIDVKGNVLYTPALNRGASFRDNPNPFEKAAHVIVALEEWAGRYERERRHEFWGGTFVPKAQVHEIRTSGPAWTELADYCYIYVDVRLVPGTNPLDVQGEVLQVVRGLGFDFDVSAYDYKRGYVAENAEPLLEALNGAHRHVFGSDPPLAPPEMISMWRDANVFNEVGIPAIGYGPNTQDPVVAAGLAGSSRPIRIQDLQSTAKVFALTALSICGVSEA